MDSLMDRALQMLNGMIDEGWEYPEAEFRVLSRLDLSPSQVDQLQQLYDEQ
ncbi:hypothetical protein [Acaryochloris marina]|uniref:Uncharacterized protein n=1 Tax=Acaryochloris marina (strain MBIC 11017) TaxID=329726 RepID=A8ZKZ1_ACAM1|nr:hypothetical protein [Acaryochloris marina]ABW31459.1 hypothetical protein AM1_A0341 [Acaryochloris marina MBIC11017]